MSIKSKGKSVTRRSAREVKKVAHGVSHRAKVAAQKIPGPSPNPATNLLIADVVMQGATMLFRRGMQKGMLQLRFSPDKAREIVQGRSLMQSAVSLAAGRMATRSIPGMLLVSGGLLAKTIFDRSIGHRDARKSGEQSLLKQADNAPEDSAEPI